jgi:hypothetical protein
MSDWKIDISRKDAPTGFRYAIITRSGEVIGWVANKQDAEFIISASAKIRRLDSDSSRHRALWFGSLIRGRSR